MKTNATFLAVAVLFLAGCSSEPAKTAEPKAAPAKAAPQATETISARTAFQKLYATARGWAGDARPIRVESQPLKDAAAQDGKAAVWRAIFASPSRRTAKAVVWSGSSGEDAPERGINQGTEDTYNPSNSSTQVFDPQFLKQDSDAAVAAALKHGGEALIKKDKAQPVAFLLDWDARTNQLIWHVSFGTSRRDARLTVDVDATTGEYVRTEK